MKRAADALNNEHHAECREDAVDFQGVARTGAAHKRRQQYTVQDIARAKAERDDERQSDQRIQCPSGEQPIGGKGCRDEELAIGQVHDPRHAVLKCQSHGDQRVHAPEHEAGEDSVRH